MVIEQGFVTNRNVELMKSIDAAGDLGFDFVEILMHGSGHRNILRDNIEAVRRRLNENGLDCVVHLPHSGVDIGSQLDRVREGAIDELTKNLRVAGRLNARKAIVHPTSNADDEDVRQQLMVQGIRTINDVATEHGIEICAENMFGKYATIHDIDEVVDETDAFLTFDTGHARIEGFSAKDSATFLDKYRKHVSHLHLNDTRKAVDEHLPIGAGTIDFETLLEPLRESAWSGTVSLEVGTENLAYIGYSKEHIETII